MEIPVPITDRTPTVPAPMPAPIDFKVVNSRTTRRDVTEAPEMHDLPPITGTINVTVQLVEHPKLTDPPPPLWALPPEDPAVIARLEELRESYRGTKLVFLSATVYDHKRTLLRIYPNGRVIDSVAAWSNLNFNYFCGFSTYRVKDADDGTLYDFGLLMGIGLHPGSVSLTKQAGRPFSMTAGMAILPNLTRMPCDSIVVSGRQSGIGQAAPDNR